MTRCPAPADLERLFWSMREPGSTSARDDELRAHVEACDRCSQQLAEAKALVTLGRTIVAPPFHRFEDVRTALLAKQVPTAPRRVLASRTWLVAPMLAAALLLTWLAWPRDQPRSDVHAAIIEHPGALYGIVSIPPDQIVRLVAGSLTVRVPPLQPGQRFRVVTGDAELEASDAAFDVVVAADRAVSVRVLHGRVLVAAAGQQARTIGSGETWRAVTEIAMTQEPSSAATPPALAITPPSRAGAAKQLRSKPRSDQPRAVEPPADATVVEEPVASPPAQPAPRSFAQQAYDDAWTAMRRNDFVAAADAFDRVAVITSDVRAIEDATFWRAVALARGGETAKAAHVLAAFVRAYPSSARTGEAHAMLGWLLVERRDLATAKRHFEAARNDRSQRIRKSADDGLRAISPHR